MRGYAPSTWASPIFDDLAFPWPITIADYLDSNLLTSKGIVTPTIALDANESPARNIKIRRIGNQIEVRSGCHALTHYQLLNEDFSSAATPPANDYTKGFLAGGTDGSYVYLNHNTSQIYFVDPSGNETLIVDNISPGELTQGGFLVALNDSSSLYMIRSFVGKLQKWAGGTNWTDIYTNSYGSPISISPSTDGGFWYATKDGKLNFMNSSGTITPVKGSQGNKWVCVVATGGSSSYKLLAVRVDGLLFSATNSRGLESEEIYPISNASLLSDGFYFAKGFYTGPSASGFGWIKGTAPKSWTNLHPITG